MKSVSVREYMTTKLITLTPDMEILKAVHELLEHNISGAPVLGSDRALVGMLTEKDCMRVALSAGYYGEYGGRVSEYMSREVETLAPDDSILRAARRFLDERYHRFPVVEDGRVVGQISRRDVLLALEDLW